MIYNKFVGLCLVLERVHTDLILVKHVHVGALMRREFASGIVREHDVPRRAVPLRLQI